MKPVGAQPEPSNFDHRVRRVGNAKLAKLRVRGQELRFDPL